MTTRKHWEWLEHFKIQMEERGITTDLVEDALFDPDEVVQGKDNRVI